MTRQPRPAFVPFALPLAWLLVSLAPLSPAAAGDAPFSAESLWALNRLGDPALAPDGRYAVVPVTRYEVANNKALTDLWLFPSREGPGRQLTSDPAPDTEPAVSPDGRWIAFVSKRGDDKESQIYVIAADGGEARRVTNVSTGAATPKWFPDGHRIAFVTRIWTDLVRWEDQDRRMQERAESKVSARVWDRAPIAYWDHFLDEREPHLFAIDVSGGAPVAVTRLSGYSLSQGDIDAFSYDISPDGLEVAFTANVDRSGTQPHYDVIVLPACGCKPARDVSEHSTGDNADPRYSPDGRWLAFSQQRIRGFEADRARLMLLERTSGVTRGLTEDWDRSVFHAVWLPDSKALVAAIEDEATGRIYRIGVPGGARQAITTTPTFGGIAVGRTAAVALRQSFSEPPTLVRLDLPAGKATKLSTFNDKQLAATAFGRVENVRYPGAADAAIQMWVVYPPGFDAARRYPVLMLLHGGPHDAIIDETHWRWNAQVFASWGYIVTWHNFHGSSGFGNAFADSINPDWISLPYADTIKAAEWLMAKPFVDRERMAAAGGSYGGFLAGVLLGREHPFKTLIAHAGVYDQYGELASDGGAEKPRFYPFWQKPAEFAQLSPHTHAAGFATPTLIIAGQMDQRVPVTQGMELFNILQSKGVPSRLVYFPDENHWVLKPQNSLFWYRTVREWLAKYVPPGAR